MGVSLSRNHSYTDSTLSRCSAASDDSLKDSSFYRKVFKAVYALKDKWSHCFLYRQRGLCAFMRVWQKPLTPQRIHLSIGWWHETSRNSDYNSCNRKKNLVQLKNLIVTLIFYTQFFHFLVLLKNYDRRRLKHKLEFLCSHLAHLELILNFLARVYSFVSLFSSVPLPCYINNK